MIVVFVLGEKVLLFRMIEDMWIVYMDFFRCVFLVLFYCLWWVMIFCICLFCVCNVCYGCCGSILLLIEVFCLLGCLWVNVFNLLVIVLFVIEIGLFFVGCWFIYKKKLVFVVCFKFFKKVVDREFSWSLSIII